MIPAWVRGTTLLVCVFGLGGVVGYEIGRVPSARAAVANPMEPHAFVERLGRDLDLDPAQSAAILSAMLRRQAGIDSAWRALRPTVHATIDSAQADIVAILRPDQRRRYFLLVQRAHGGMMRAADSAGAPARCGRHR